MSTVVVASPLNVLMLNVAEIFMAMDITCLISVASTTVEK